LGNASVEEPIVLFPIVAIFYTFLIVNGIPDGVELTVRVGRIGGSVGIVST
jgi:hypothetical protein